MFYENAAYRHLNDTIFSHFKFHGYIYRSTFCLRKHYVSRVGGSKDTHIKVVFT